MRAPALWSLLLCPAIAAQELSLREHLERPLLYLHWQAGSGTAGGVELLQNPVLSRLGRSVTAEGGIEAMLGDLAGGAAAEVELAWTGTLPARGEHGDRPLLILRALLQPEHGRRLQALFASGGFGEPHRRLGAHRSYLLSGSDDGDPSAAGTRVEAVLVERQLLVSNHGRALAEVLGAAPVQGATLAADPQFVRLRKELPEAPGAIWLFADLPQVLHRFGVPLRRSALPAAAAARIEANPQGGELAATLIAVTRAGLTIPGLRGLPDAKPVPAASLIASLRQDGGAVWSLAAEPSGRGGRRGQPPADRAAADDRGRLHPRRGRGAGRWPIPGLQLEKAGELQLARLPDPRGRWDQRLEKLLLDAVSPRQQVVALGAWSWPMAGNRPGLDLAASLGAEPADTGEVLWRVRVLCAAH